MATWLFDLGNTRLKYAPLLADGTVGDATACEHGAGDTWLKTLPHGDVACMTSVASEAHRLALVTALVSRFQRVHQVQTDARLGDLRIAYATPQQLGVDRFLAMLAVAGTSPALLVGVGTALTIDVLAADGQHQGGRIAPSPQLMREALHQRAAQLPVDGGQFTVFADTTVDALASGCEGAALALVKQSLQEAEACLQQAPMLYVHGGGAQALRPHLPAHRFMPNLVLDGLVTWHRLCLA